MEISKRLSTESLFCAYIIKRKNRMKKIFIALIIIFFVFLSCDVPTNHVEPPTYNYRITIELPDSNLFVLADYFVYDSNNVLLRHQYEHWVAGTHIWTWDNCPHPYIKVIKHVSILEDWTNELVHYEVLVYELTSFNQTAITVYEYVECNQ